MTSRIPKIAVTCSREEPPEPYIESVRATKADVVPLIVDAAPETSQSLEGVHGLVLTGGADVDPKQYGQVADPTANVRAKPRRDLVEIPLIREALARDLPILGICRGMQALNVALGGTLIQDLPGHSTGDPKVPVKHDVFIPPGVRLTAILGVGGFIRVNSIHHQGIKWPQKAPGLLVSAYSLKDGIIEAIESSKHRWVVGVQWHPERRGEVSKVFDNLFTKLVAAAQESLRSK